MLEFNMTYVDDDDFEELEASDGIEDDLEEKDAGRCDECGLRVKKDDAIVCPACTAVYHEWCAEECNRCKTPLKPTDNETPKAVKVPGRKAAAPKKRAAVAPKTRAPKVR
jgi:predicted sulfurtransferase